MAKKNDTTFFENKLLDFVTAKDPMLEMLQWVMDKFMEIEVVHKTGAEKGSHAETRTGYRCGYRIRRLPKTICDRYNSAINSEDNASIQFFRFASEKLFVRLCLVLLYAFHQGIPETLFSVTFHFVRSNN